VRYCGKWWTSGNGFGDSEVIFTQTGAQMAIAHKQKMALGMLAHAAKRLK